MVVLVVLIQLAEQVSLEDQVILLPKDWQLQAEEKQVVDTKMVTQADQAEELETAQLPDQ
ncbi:MAG: hypothetical protein CMO06_18470 [Thalassospira sp.]|nr:hypothetical protein [Thalassospira sp.]